jgi:hypothetical protein
LADKERVKSSKLLLICLASLTATALTAMLHENPKASPIRALPSAAHPSETWMLVADPSDEPPALQTPAGPSHKALLER